MYIIKLLVHLQLTLRDNSVLSFITYVAIYLLQGVYYALTSQNMMKVDIGISPLPIKVSVSVYTRVLLKWPPVLARIQKQVPIGRYTFYYDENICLLLRQGTCVCVFIPSPVRVGTLLLEVPGTPNGASIHIF